MQVPKYERQVGTLVPDVSRPPADAFGLNIIQSQAANAKEALDIGIMVVNHLNELNEQKKTQEVLDAEAQFRQEMDDVLYNEDNGYLTRTLNNADGVTIEFDQKIKELKEKYLNTFKDSKQKQRFHNLAQNHYTTARSAVVRHEAGQTREAKITSLNTSLAQNEADAAKNPNYETVLKLIADSHAKQDFVMKQLGGFDEATINLEKQKQAGKIATAAISTLLDKNQDHQSAKRIYESVKQYLPGDVAAKIEDAIEDTAFQSQMESVWQKMKGFRMADGLPDLRKMEQEIGKLGYNLEKKEKLWDYIKSKASEENLMIIRAREANDRAFMNSIYSIQKSGGNLDRALKEARKYGIDPYDRGMKEEIVKKLFAKKTETDPYAYMALWKGVLQKTVSERDIDAALKNGQITPSDWESLKKDYYRSELKEIEQSEKTAWDRIELLAYEKFGKDKQKRDTFMYEMKLQGKGKSPEELLNLADEKLKKVGGWWIFGQQEQFKADLKQQDTENRAWGKIYASLGGKDVVMEIGKGVLYSGKKSWGINDIDNFVKAIGGSKALKAGSPEMNAIKSLIRHGALVTPKNIKAVLAKYKDGIIP